MPHTPPNPPLGLAIALGSNLGDRLSHLREARRRLEARLGPATASAVYQTQPVGCPPGSLPFLNAVLSFPASNDPPLQLMHWLQSLEQVMGRAADRERNAPRPVDIDILCNGENVQQDPVLTLPHPRWRQRRFVLQPLSEVCGQCYFPGETQTVAEIHAQLDSPEPSLHLFIKNWAIPRPTGYHYAYPGPAVVVDLVIFGESAAGRQVLLIQRAKAPCAGKWALPGGFVDQDEDLPVAAARELVEETGLEVPELRQTKAYGTPGRDPRGHTVSVAFTTTVSAGAYQPTAGDDASQARWFPLDSLPELAFDHQKILTDANL